MTKVIRIGSIYFGAIFLATSFIACQSSPKKVVSSYEIKEQKKEDIYFKYMVAPKNINQTDGSGQTALYRAVRLNDIAAVKIFLDNPAVNIYTKPSLLLRAAFDGNKEIVDLLIAKGARLNEQNKDGYTALHLATRKGNTYIVEALLNAGANPNLKDKNGRTALLDASLRGHLEIVDLLVKANANVDMKDKMDRTALIIASALDHKEVSKALLSFSADVNARDKKGRSALIYAAKKGNVDLVKDIIQVGGNVDLKGKDRLALEAAATSGHTEIVTYLIQADKANKKKIK